MGGYGRSPDGTVGAENGAVRHFMEIDVRAPRLVMEGGDGRRRPVSSFVKTAADVDPPIVVTKQPCVVFQRVKPRIAAASAELPFVFWGEMEVVCGMEGCHGKKTKEYQ